MKQNDDRSLPARHELVKVEPDLRAGCWSRVGSKPARRSGSTSLLTWRPAFAWRCGWVACLAVSISGEPVLAAASPPRLAVVISIDQLRGDYLQRFRPYFGEGGFSRLLAEGMEFQDAHYRHAVLSTAPGHATILTGVHPAVHGIVANDWYDRIAGRMVGSAGDAAAPLVGMDPGAVVAPALAARAGRSPHRLLATTVGDQLKLQGGGRSRVIAMANKDRGAIFLGGRLADAAYWVEGGRFVTSTYYREALPAWVEAFNAEGRVEKDFGRTWDRLLEPAVYEAVQGADDAVGEESRLGLGTTFPRRVDGGKSEISQTFYEAHRLTPYSTELLGAFAEHAIRAEVLGQDEPPDLLCIGFSQIDYAGHSYGPDSHEIMDAMVRMDRVIASLLNCLDAEVGEGKYVVVLTSDHGVTPLPERVQASGRGIEAGRFDGPATDKHVEAALTLRFGAPPDDGLWSMRDAYGYHVRDSALAASGLAREEVATALCDALLTAPAIAAAATRTQVLAAGTDGDGLPARWRRGFHPDRSQDVVFILKPYFVDRIPAGTNHGGPYACDDHVPLVWFGAGVPSGVWTGRVGIEQIAPTLAAVLGVPPPPEAHGERLF